jgi:hypothetical protein
VDSLTRPSADTPQVPREVSAPNGKPLNLVRRLLHRKDSADSASNGSAKPPVSAKPSVVERLEAFFAQDLPSSMQVLPADIKELSPPSLPTRTEKDDLPVTAKPQPNPEPTKQNAANGDGAASSTFSAVRLVRAAAKDAVSRFQTAYEEIETSLKGHAQEIELRHQALSSSAEQACVNLQQLQSKMTADATENFEKASQPVIARSAQRLQETTDASIVSLREKLDAEKQRFADETQKQFESLRASRQTFIDDSAKQLAATVQSSLDTVTRSAVEKTRSELGGLRQAVISDAQTAMAATCRSSVEAVSSDLTQDLVSKARVEMTCAQQAVVNETQSNLDKIVRASLERLQSLANASLDQAESRLTASHQELLDRARAQIQDMTRDSLQTEIKGAVENGRRELGNMVDGFLAKAVPQIEAELEKLVSRRAEALRAQAPALSAPPPRQAAPPISPARVTSSPGSSLRITEPPRLAPLTSPAPKLGKLEFTLPESGGKPRFDSRALVAGISSGVKLGLAVGAVILAAFIIYVFSSPVIRLRANAPAAFFDDSPSLSARQRAAEHQTAQAYWDIAVNNVETQYGFGSTLPSDPPDYFRIKEQGSAAAAPGGDEAARARYWQKLRDVWPQADSWERTSNEGVTWLRNTWDSSNSKINQLFKSSSASDAP